MTEATEFRVTVPGLYKKRNGGTQRILLVGHNGKQIVAVGFDDDGGIYDWGENGLWRYGNNDRVEGDEDLVELIEADDPPAPQPLVPTPQPAATDEPIELRRAKAAHDLLTLYDYNKYHAEKALEHIRALRLDI